MFRLPPFPYQLEIFEKTKHCKYKALFLEQGLGKSKIAIDLASYHYEHGNIKNLIIATDNTVLSAWHHSQLPAHLWKPEEAIIHRYNAEGKERVFRDFCSTNTKDLKILLVNKEVFRGSTMKPHENIAKLISTGATMLIADESTWLKNSVNVGSRTWRRVRKHCEYVYILTGTPEPNSPDDWFGQLLFLDEKILGTPTLHKFRNRYCTSEPIWGVKTAYGHTPQKTVDLKNRMEFYKQLEPFCFRLKKVDVLPDLPEKMYQEVAIDLHPEADLVYNKLKHEAYAVLVNEAGEQGKVSITNVLTQMTRLQTVASGFVKDDKDNIIDLPNAKAEYLKILLADEVPTIVWCRFRHTVEQLKEAYPHAAVLWGGMSPEETRVEIASFSDGETNLLLCVNSDSSSKGLTFTNCARNVYFSNSFNAEHRLQSEDRTHRIGQTAASVQYIDLIGYASGKATVDQHVLETLKRKATTLGTMPSMTLTEVKELLGV